MRYLLQQGTGVTIPAGVIVVLLQSASGQQAPELEAAVVDGSGPERRADPLSSHPGRLVLSVTEPVLVRLRLPAGSAAFQPQSVYSLTVMAEGEDGDKAVLRSIDMSGLLTRDLVRLDPSGDEIVVTAIAQTEDVALPPLADAARVAAREVLGVAAASAERVVDLRIAVDGSASLRPLVEAGRVLQVLELLMGIGQVVSGSQRVGCVVCGQSMTRLPDQPLEGFAGPVAAAVAAVPPSVGFRSDLVPDAGDRAVSYLITDALPADLVATRTDLLHLVVLSGAGEFATHARPDTVGATVVNPDHDLGSLDQALIRHYVESLLADYRRRLDQAPR